MRFTFTTSSKKAIDLIKERMIQQHRDRDINRFRLKFTKKKEFIAVPMPYSSPAFQLYLNDKYLCTFIFNNNLWKEFKY